MNIVVDTLFYTKEALAQKKAGVNLNKLNDPKYIYYNQCMFKTQRIESVVPSANFKGHCEIYTYNGDSFVIKITVQEYAQLVDHIDARKALCQINN